MSSYTRDADYTQTMSGRVIPARQQRPESEEDGARTSTMDSASTDRTLTVHGNAYPRPMADRGGGVPNAPQLNSRQASAGSQASRTISMASTIVSTPPPESQSTRPSLPSGMAATRSVSQTTAASQAVTQTPKRPSLVYGAMLSHVALAFRER
ncbi:RHO1 GDP-GTP exchange protein 2, partial [Teratosphaeriaceae sp. CCFEE 6253]